MLFNIGDIVTRNSYHNDTFFMITHMDGNIAYLKGINLRLYADSDVSDLVKVDGGDVIDDDRITKTITSSFNLDRSEFFYLPGKVLHIDSDIKLSNDLAKPYKIRKNAKIQNYKNHQKKHKMTKI